MRIGRRGVEKVQAENRRLGIPNVYAVDGVVMYELLDGTLSRIDPRTEYQDVDDVEGCIIAANHKRRVRIGNRYGIVLHNQWTSDVERKVQRPLSISFPIPGNFPTATEDCQAIIARIFVGFDD